MLLFINIYGFFVLTRIVWATVPCGLLDTLLSAGLWSGAVPSVTLSCEPYCSRSAIPNKMNHTWPIREPLKNDSRTIHKPFMNHIWTIHEQFMNHTWTIYEPFMNHIWTIHEQFMNHTWTIYEPSMSHIWTIHKPFMNHTWTIHEPYMNHIWTIHVT